MATNLTLGLIDDVLEELYLSEDRLNDIIMRDNPALGILPKSTEGGGKFRHVQLKHIRPQGRSATFADAVSDRVGSTRVGYDVTWTSNYQIAGIDGDVLDDAAGNRVILIDHIETEMDGAIDNIKDDLATSLFRNSGGARGVQAGAAASDVITLANPEDIVNFEVGMVIVADATDGTGIAIVDATESTIVALDRDAGTIEFDTAAATLIDTNFLFVAGDYGLKWAGFDSWIPLAAPTGGDSFFGVDRSVDPVRLAGVRYDGTGDTINAGIVNGAARIRRWKKGSQVDIAFLNPLKFAELENTLDGRKRVEEVMGSGQAASLGYKAIMLATPAGDVPVVSDPNCQLDTCWLLRKDSWMIETTGQMVRLLDEDGNAFLRQSSQDGWELRCKSRGNVWNREPGSNGRVTVA